MAEPELVLDFGGTLMVEALRFEILALGIDEPANVHVWEIMLRSDDMMAARGLSPLLYI